jgi:prepilin peptidase CpaA
MDILAWIAIILGCAAAADDLRRRRISNWISVSGIAGGLIYHTVRHGLRGLGWALAGTVIGFAIFLVVYALGGMGGGDLKLMAAFGAILGPAGIFTAALLAAIAGGLMAAGSVLLNRRNRTIPYAPAIVVGAWLVLLGGR